MILCLAVDCCPDGQLFCGSRTTRGPFSLLFSIGEVRLTPDAKDLDMDRISCQECVLFYCEEGNQREARLSVDVPYPTVWL